MAAEGKQEFTKQMRKATREIHDISDALVNAKLGIGNIVLLFDSVNLNLYENFSPAMSDNSIWAEGLLCFYEIFKILLIRHTSITD